MIWTTQQTDCMILYMESKRINYTGCFFWYLHQAVLPVVIASPKGTVIVEAKDDIQKIYDSLCQVQVTGEGEASRWMDLRKC